MAELVTENIRTEVVSLTPQLAVEWLKHNNNNRAARQVRVDYYARLMRDGQWLLNGEPIIFDSNGEMTNGQHRCLAVIKSGITIQVLAVRGVSPESRPTVDAGIKRTVSDVLGVRGEENTASLAAGLNLLWRYEQGVWHRGGSPNPSAQDLIEVLERNPSIRRSIPQVKKLLHVVSTRNAIVLHHLMAQKHPDEAEPFFNGLSTGADLHIEAPVRVLRERLLGERVRKSKLDATYERAIVIKAWNATLKGTRVRYLRWREDEQFPEIS